VFGLLLSVQLSPAPVGRALNKWLLKKNMARFAKIARREGGYTFINVDLITSLEVSALNADASIVRFDKDNTVTVAQRLDDLFQALSDSKPL
jgi:hypothetical protein